MLDYTARFQTLNNKLMQLQKLQEQAGRTIERLGKEKTSLQEEIEELRKKNGALEEQLLIARTAAANMDEESKKAFEKKINHYLGEIDKVINHLNS